jgi:hypothetical protein
MRQGRPPGLLSLWMVAVLLLASLCGPVSDAAVTGDESVASGRIYFRAYDMLTGEKLTWGWETVDPAQALNFLIKVDGAVINSSIGDSGSGEYVAVKDCRVVLEWANQWMTETRFHFWVDREISSTRYIPYAIALALVIAVPAVLILLIKRRADRKNA